MDERNDSICEVSNERAPSIIKETSNAENLNGRPLRPASAPTFPPKNGNNMQNEIASAPASVQPTKEIGGGNAQENEQHEEEEEQLEGGAHSIYGRDPTTKKRFYEPHKRPGCTEEYCLSRVTQIGERICNIENKLIQLEELFEELVNKGKIDRNNDNDHQLEQPEPAQPNPQINNIPSQNFVAPANVAPNVNQIRPAVVRPIGPRYTGPCLISRLLAPPKVSTATTLENINSFRTMRPLPIAKKSANAFIRPQEKQHNPVPVPYKPLQNGVRVYFLDEQRRTPNHCKICFAIFSDPSPNNRIVQKNPIPAAHLNRHLTPILETYLCSICCKGGVPFRIHFLSLPAVVQHLLNHHGISGSSQIQKGYAKAVNNENATEELRAFINEQLGDNNLIVIDGNNKMGDQQPALKCEDTLGDLFGIPPKYTTTKNAPNNAKKAVKPNRKYPEAPTFNLDGDCLDKLLECPLPCTLADRLNRLKNIDRTPANHLIVNIGQNVLAEKDFNLANIIVTQNLKAIDGAGKRKRGTSSLHSTATGERKSRSQSRISSIIDAVAKGSRKRHRRSRTESTQKSECPTESGKGHSDDETQQSSNFDNETADGSEESSEDSYRPNRPKNKRKTKRGMMDHEYDDPTPSTSSASMPQLPTNSSRILSYRVHMPGIHQFAQNECSTSSNAPTPAAITPSSALMQQIGYVASKGIYASTNEEEQMDAET